MNTAKDFPDRSSCTQHRPTQVMGLALVLALGPPIASDAQGCRTIGRCGDGVVDEREECDDGNDFNGDACLNSCIHAKCGDGFRWDQGNEACDDANDDDDDGCTRECKVPICGDGFVQPSLGEECDDGYGVDKMDDCSDSCNWNPRYVFVSSVKVYGDMSADVGIAEPLGSGLGKADAWCQQLAGDAGRPGVYRAWLSSGSFGPVTRFDNVDVNADEVPYRRVDGLLIASSWSSLVSGECESAGDCLENPIEADETGTVLRSDEVVWTNTTVVGQPAVITDDCAGWESSEGDGRTGRSKVSTPFWTTASKRSCDQAARLYCFKQAPPKSP